MSVRLAPAGAHGGEGGVARRVEEDQRSSARRSLVLDRVGAEVLGDAAGLAGRHAVRRM